MAVTGRFRVRSSDREKEALLVAKAAAGDIEAALELRSRFRERLLEYLKRWLWNKQWADVLADDGVDQVMECLAQYQPGRSAFNTWAHKVAFSAIMKRISKMRLNRNDISTEDLVTQLMPAMFGPGVEFVKSRLHEEVERLDPVRRLIIWLSFFEGQSDPEIAQRVHMAPRRVCRWRKQTLGLLRERLGDVLFTFLRPEMGF